jgi:phospholipid/cholesterol/gamma-HCH transport system permease protein
MSAVARRDEPKPPAPTKSVGELIKSGPAFESLKSAGEMGALAVKTARVIVAPPYSWVQETIVQTNVLVRRCALPLGVSMFSWTVGYAFILLTGFVKLLGAEDRMPGALVLGFTREPIVWVTGMVFAGATGAAICADLAARKNRDELDALSVLGVDQIRLLIVPRVIASVIACVVLGTFAIFVTIVTDYALAPFFSDLAPDLVFEGIVASMITSDQIAAMTKFFLIGLLVGVVSCAKGLSAKGGTEGVGRAVNQTVVVTFAGVWVINSVFNLAYLTIFPQLADFKG